MWVGACREDPGRILEVDYRQDLAVLGLASGCGTQARCGEGVWWEGPSRLIGLDPGEGCADSAPGERLNAVWEN